MTDSSALSFAWTPWTVVIAIAAITIVSAAAYVACVRAAWTRPTLLLESSRVALVVLAAILLGGPQWVRQTRPDRKPTVVVLWDDSASMTTRDVIPKKDVAGDAMSRRQAIASVADPDTWAAITSRAEVVITPFSGTSPSRGDGTDTRQESPGLFNSAAAAGTSDPPPVEPGTDLSTPLIDAVASQDHLLGVVIASDGDWNQGVAPVQAAARLRGSGVPVFAIPAGSPSRMPDVEVVSFDVPTFAIAGKKVRIPFSIDSSLPRDRTATVTMASADGAIESKPIRIAAMGRTREFIDWKPDHLGEFTLTLTVPRQAGEIRGDNNAQSAPISIREERLRVLVIESAPRWEYRYLRNALSRDPGVEASCLLFHPSLDKRGGGNSDYIAEFPATKEELSKYDVVFVGDVGLSDDQLTDDQCEWLQRLVQRQASGLVFMPGFQGRQFELLDTPLAELMPVVMDDVQRRGWGSRTPQQFELTALGRRSLLTKLADTADENLEVWENLPGFQWHAPVLAAKPGAETLAVHAQASNDRGRLPLLVTRTYGAGKVLFMGTDGAWRWRKGVEDKYHYRFWGQVVRWMAYRRNMARGETMRLYHWPEQPRVRQTITVNANVMEASGEPLADGDVRLRVVSPAGRVSTVRLESSGEAWGAFAGRHTFEEPGVHRVTLFCEQTGGVLETTIAAQGLALEQVGKPARPDVMEEIARVSRGRVLTVDRVDEIRDYLISLPDPPPRISRTSVWSHPAVAGLFVILLGMFWIARKGAGLI